MLYFIFFLRSCISQQYFSITYPLELTSDVALTQMKCSLSNFGFVPYETQLSGIVNLSKPIDQCTTEVSQTEQFKEVRFLIARRGTCYFSIKALNAQASGYSMLIIVDNLDEDVSNKNLVAIETEEINIPSIIISKQNGEKIINYLNQEVALSVNAKIIFPTLTKSSIVKYQYWFNSMNSSNYLFLQQFYSFQNQLRESLKFQPCYFGYYNQSSVDCQNEEYCVPDPDGTGTLTDNDSMTEIVQQLCIHQIDSIKWWDYAVKFGSFCLRNPNDCRDDLIVKIGLNNSDIETCIDNSYEETGRNGKNQLLNQYFKEGYFPNLFVNNHILRGSLTVVSDQYDNKTGAIEILNTSYYGPLQAICKSFEEGLIPQECQHLLRGQGIYPIDLEINKSSIQQNNIVITFQYSRNEDLSLNFIFLIGILILQ